jgi:uncharacterized protein
MPRKIISKIRHHFHEVLKIKKSPHSIAMGFAIGTFIAILPTFGLGLILGLIVVLIYRNVSKIALVAAFIVWNPLILTPIYFFSYQVGDFIFGELPVVEYDIKFFERIYNLTRRVLVGNTIISALFSIMSYFLVKRLSAAYQKRKSQKGKK